MAPHPRHYFPDARVETGDYRGNILLGVAIAAMLLTSVVVVLRFYAKTLGGARMGYDDSLIHAAYITNLGLCALCIGLPPPP